MTILMIVTKHTLVHEVVCCCFRDLCFKGEFRYGTFTVNITYLNEKGTTLDCCGLKQLLYHKLFINSVAT